MNDALTIQKLLHDLKSPVGALQVLQSKASLTPDHKKLLNLTLNFLNALIDKSLGPTQYLITGEEIEKIIVQAVDEKRAVHSGVYIKLKLHGCNWKSRYYGAALDLRRVVGNLIDNAIHASGPVPDRIQIDLHLIEDARGCRLICRDYGRGFRLEMEHVPDLGFGTTRTGWGLGLSIVKEICVKNRWKFRLLPHALKGTEAILFL